MATTGELSPIAGDKHWLDPYIRQQAAHYGMTVEQKAVLFGGAADFDELLEIGEVDEPVRPVAPVLSFTVIFERLVRLRATRRRLGWFDHCSDSFDMRSTSARAWRLYQRVAGVREPLLHPENGRPIPGRSYHY